jgi:hypothetical protein
MRTRKGPQIDVDDPGSDHVALVREAVKRESDEYTAVWCVLDTELNRGLTKRIVADADTHGVELALSTPCFELWLILHHIDHAAPFQSAKEAKKKLTALMPSWREAATAFADFRTGIDDACRRAQRLDPTGEDHLKNPSTNVWKLIEKLNEQSLPQR